MLEVDVTSNLVKNQNSPLYSGRPLEEAVPKRRSSGLHSVMELATLRHLLIKIDSAKCPVCRVCLPAQLKDCKYLCCLLTSIGGSA